MNINRAFLEDSSYMLNGILLRRAHVIEAHPLPSPETKARHVFRPSKSPFPAQCRRAPTGAHTVQTREPKPWSNHGKSIYLPQDFFIDIFQCLRSVPTKINECDETTWVAGSVPGTDGSRAEDASGIK